MRVCVRVCACVRVWVSLCVGGGGVYVYLSVCVHGYTCVHLSVRTSPAVEVGPKLLRPLSEDREVNSYVPSLRIKVEVYKRDSTHHRFTVLLYKTSPSCMKVLTKSLKSMSMFSITTQPRVKYLRDT